MPEFDFPSYNHDQSTPPSTEKYDASWKTSYRQHEGHVAQVEFITKQFNLGLVHVQKRLVAMDKTYKTEEGKLRLKENVHNLMRKQVEHSVDDEDVRKAVLDALAAAAALSTSGGQSRSRSHGGGHVVVRKVRKETFADGKTRNVCNLAGQGSKLYVKSIGQWVALVDLKKGITKAKEAKAKAKEAKAKAKAKARL